MKSNFKNAVYNAIGFSQAEYLKMLAKSVALLVLTLALNFVSYFVLIQDIIIYTAVKVVIFILVNSFLFVLRILEFREIKKLVDRRVKYENRDNSK